MANERKNNLGLKRLLLVGALGFGFIGFGDVVSHVPLNKDFIEGIEYGDKAWGYAALSASAIIIGGASLMAGGKRFYEISRELRDD